MQHGNGMATLAKAVGAAITSPGEKSWNGNAALEALSKDYQDSFAELESFIKARGGGGAMASASEGAPDDEDDEERDEFEAKLGEQAKKKKKALPPAADQDEEEPAMLGKSLPTGTVEIDGVQHEVVDGLAAIEAIRTEVAALATQVTKSVGAQDTGVMVLAKAVHTQGTLIKALIEELGTWGLQPRGRKSVVSMMNKSVGGGEVAMPKQTAEAVLAKAVDLSAQGKLMPSAVREIEYSVNRGLPVPGQYASLLN